MIHHLTELNQYQSLYSAIWPRTTNTMCIHVLLPTVESLAYTTYSVPESTLLQKTMTIPFDLKMYHSLHHLKRSTPSIYHVSKSKLQQNAIWNSPIKRMEKKEKPLRMETTRNYFSLLLKLSDGELNTSANIMPQRTPPFLQYIHLKEYKLLPHATSPPPCDEAAKL